MVYCEACNFKFHGGNKQCPSCNHPYKKTDKSELDLDTAFDISGMTTTAGTTVTTATTTAVVVSEPGSPSMSRDDFIAKQLEVERERKQSLTKQKATLASVAKEHDIPKLANLNTSEIVLFSKFAKI